jgi:Protein involved in chromosome segregation, interacts with SMC proteins
MDNQNEETLQQAEPTQNKAELSQATAQDKQEEQKEKEKNFSEQILTTKVEENAEEEEKESVEELTHHYSTFTKGALLDEMRTLSASDNFETMKLKSNLVRNAFRIIVSSEKKEAKEAFVKEGGNAEEFTPKEDALETEFYNYYSTYRDKRQKFLDAQEKEKEENVQKKLSLLEELKTLLDSEDTLKEIYDSFNTIQERWKAIGAVPRAQVNELWQNYHFLIEKFYDKVKINRELRDLDLKKNLDSKIELCEKAEGLIIEESINKSFKALQDLHRAWKEIGPVPMDKNEEIWERFKSASDKINARREQYYEKLKDELDKNLLAKTALCEKAEEVLKRELNNSKAWNDVTTEMNDMLKLWKTIGHVPQKDNETIWARFKGSLDTFFANKKEVFDKMKEEQDVNYNKKIELCVKAEAIADRQDWKKATAELLDLQKEWKEIGYVSKKVSEKIWLRFRAACDKFFEAKSNFYVASRASEDENLKSKEALIEEVKAFSFGPSKEDNLSAIKDFQRRWSEIGYVPSTEKERLQKEFRASINIHFEKLQIDTRQLQLDSFKERIASKEGFSKERKYLSDKIQQLKDDINIWENNLGFLASSKQADILKAEFLKKVENAKKDIALNEAKLKLLLQNKKEENK